MTPARCRARSLALLLVLATAGCHFRSVTRKPDGRDLLDGRRTGGPTALAASWQIDRYALDLGEALQRRGHPPDDPRAVYVLTGEGRHAPMPFNGLMAWNVLMSVPSLVLPVPLLGEYECGATVKIHDRETGILLTQRSADFTLHITGLSLWGMVAGVFGTGDDVTDAAATLADEWVRTLGSGEVRTALERARADLLEDRRVLELLGSVRAGDRIASADLEALRPRNPTCAVEAWRNLKCSALEALPRALANPRDHGDTVAAFYWRTSTPGLAEWPSVERRVLPIGTAVRFAGSRRVDLVVGFQSTTVQHAGAVPYTFPASALDEICVVAVEDGVVTSVERKPAFDAAVAENRRWLAHLERRLSADAPVAGRAGALGAAPEQR